MKHSKKIILIELVLIISSFFSLIVFPINYYAYIGILVGLSIFLYFVFKPDGRKERFNKDILLITVITFLFYYALTYFLGFFAGFYYSNYSRTIVGMLRNVIPAFIIICAVETIREVLIKNNVYHKTIVWLTPVICFLLEIPTLVNFRIFHSKADLLSIVLTIVIPTIVKNIVLTYITYKSNKNNSIIYQLFIMLPNYLLPVFPNLGEFFTIVLNTSLPVLLLVLIMNISTVKFEKIKNSRSLAHNGVIGKILVGSMISLIIIMIYLTSNMFRFASLAIGSESMTGSINKGDVVILDKKYKNLKKNDVIAFKEQDKIIVHRVIGIKHRKKVKYYQTKGDANKKKDGWLVSKNGIVGKVKVRIRWIGWPTVALSEMLQR